jgi:hypothetical protein
MTLCHTFARNWRTLGMCSMAHAAKMGDVMGGGVGKGVFGMITLTLVLSTATAFVYTIYLGYDFGASQFTGTAFKRGAQEVWDELAGWINNAHPYKSTHVIYSSSGILVMFFLLIVHHRFTWWPLHPIGFGVVATHSVNMAVFNFFFRVAGEGGYFQIGRRGSLSNRATSCDRYDRRLCHRRVYFLRRRPDLVPRQWASDSFILAPLSFFLKPVDTSKELSYYAWQS